MLLWVLALHVLILKEYMPWFSKICRKPDIPWKELVGWDVHPSSYLSPFMTTKNTGVSLLFRILYSGRLLAATGCPTVRKQRVFMSLAPSHPSAGLPIGVSALTLPHYLSQEVSLSASTLFCARRDPERLGPGHILSPSLFLLWWGWGAGGAQKMTTSPELSDVEEDIERAAKIRLFQRRTKAFQWLMLS